MIGKADFAWLKPNSCRQQFRVDNGAGLFRKFWRVELRECRLLLLQSHTHADDPDILLEHNQTVGITREQARTHFRQQHGCADRRVAGKRQLGCWREDADFRRVGRVFRFQNKHGL